MKIRLARCIVRSWRLEDAPSIALYADNRDIWINLRDAFPHPYTEQDAERFIVGALRHSPETVFAIEAESIGRAGPASPRSGA